MTTERQVIDYKQRFPFKITRVTHLINNYLVLPHWHEQLEIIQVVSGSVQVKVDELTYIGEEGDIFFFNSRQVHSVMNKSERGEPAIHGMLFDQVLLYRAMANQETEQWISSLLGHRKIRNQYTPAHKLWPKLNGGFKTVIEEFTSKPIGYELLIISEIYSFIISILRIYAMEISVNLSPVRYIEQYAKLKPAVDYIEKHYANKMDLKEISSQANMSSFHFTREFKKLFGITPMQMVIDVRLHRAKQLLLDSNISVTEVASLIGFYDVGHFSNVFKQKNGCTPLQFRKRFDS
ncbi:AraC family transcriptional regulator [Paenibacillus sp. J5C_2022]|uniref:AraC family transcriptional regulator n=1 Tax=Paenibacillus sp. J5C2022 TaxID=2977129 RepID=UPI0021D3D82E|nr:AraC family transcriptional regulator [Paenibacillus sp. J5C2022]MCU6712584.1 AraC family transcriptional regulator [Paenibacillus sp. J5C2022]